MVVKELNFNQFLPLGGCDVVLKGLTHFLKVPPLRGCRVLERTHF